MSSFFWCRPMLRRSAVMLLVLAWSSLGFCSEMQKAIAAGNVDKVKALLENDPHLIFEEQQGKAPLLHMAAARHSKDIVALLLANKADINAKDDMGRTPLHCTIQASGRDTAEVLLNNGADVNARDIHGETPLHLAAKFGFADVAEVLLAHKADMSARNSAGRLPLLEAVLLGQPVVAQLLREHGAYENVVETPDYTVFGDDFFASPLENGDRALINSTRVWQRIPDALIDRLYTKSPIGGATRLIVRAKRDVVLEAITGIDQPGIDLAGWEQTRQFFEFAEDHGLPITGKEKHQARVAVIRKKLAAGEELVIPRGNWSGVMLLLPKAAADGKEKASGEAGGK